MAVKTNATRDNVHGRARFETKDNKKDAIHIRNWESVNTLKTKDVFKDRCSKLLPIYAGVSNY